MMILHLLSHIYYSINKGIYALAYREGKNRESAMSSTRGELASCMTVSMMMMTFDFWRDPGNRPLRIQNVNEFLVQHYGTYILDHTASMLYETILKRTLMSWVEN